MSAIVLVLRGLFPLEYGANSNNLGITQMPSHYVCEGL